MAFSKSLRIALIAAVGFFSLSAFAPAKADAPLSEVPPVPLNLLTKEQLVSHLGVETYDSVFRNRLNGLVMTNNCNGLNADMITVKPNNDFRNCLEDKGYIFVGAESLRFVQSARYEIFREGRLLFFMDAEIHKPPLLQLEVGTLSDLATFKETFKMSDQKFAIEVDAKK